MPPVTLAVAEPEAAPLQLAGVGVPVAERTAGATMVAIVVFVHPFASVTVHVYVPALKPEAVAFDPPLGLQE